MRKITEAVVTAFLNHKATSVGNTSTDGQALYLHGNRIAWHGKLEDGRLGVFLTMANWNTNTTKERLRGVLALFAPNVLLWTVKGQVRIGGVDIDSDSVIFVSRSGYVEKRTAHPGYHDMAKVLETGRIGTVPRSEAF